MSTKQLMSKLESQEDMQISTLQRLLRNPLLLNFPLIPFLSRSLEFTLLCFSVEPLLWNFNQKNTPTHVNMRVYILDNIL